MAEAWIVPASVCVFALAKTGEDLPEIQRRRLFQFFIKLLNGSPKAQRLADRFDSGDISGDTLLELIG